MERRSPAFNLHADSLAPSAASAADSSRGETVLPDRRDTTTRRQRMICDTHTCDGCRYLEQDDCTASLAEFLASCQHAKCKVVRLVRQQISKLQDVQVRVPAFPVIGRDRFLRHVLAPLKSSPVPLPPPAPHRSPPLPGIVWRTSPPRFKIHPRRRAGPTRVLILLLHGIIRSVCAICDANVWKSARAHRGGN